MSAPNTRLTSQLLGEPLVDPSRILTSRWYTYFRDQDQAQLQGPTRLTTVTPEDPENVATGTLPISTTDALASGEYRVTVYARITTPAGATSDLDVTIGWTDDGVSCTKTASDVQIDWPITGNTTASTASFTVTFRSGQEPATPITYAFVYNSTPAAAMFYDFDVVLELLSLT